MPGLPHVTHTTLRCPYKAGNYGRCHTHFTEGKLRYEEIEPLPLVTQLVTQRTIIWRQALTPESVMPSSSMKKGQPRVACSQVRASRFPQTTVGEGNTVFKGTIQSTNIY